MSPVSALCPLCTATCSFAAANFASRMKPFNFDSEVLTRRRFLQQGLSGAISTAGLVPGIALSADSRGAPFSYNVDRYRKVDPKWLHYEKVVGFATPRPEPRRLAMDSDGRLYLAAGRAVVVMDLQGAVLDEFECAFPVRCLAIAADGTRYVGGRDWVEIFDTRNQSMSSWAPIPGRPFISGIAVGDSDVFAADAGNRVVLRYDRSGKLIGRIGERNAARNIPGLIAPSPCLDVEIGRDGLLRINNPGRHRVELYTFEGDLELSWGRPSAAIEGFCGCCNPVNLELLPDGRCVTFEKGLPRVKVYSLDGKLESVVAGPEQFHNPGNVSPALDAEGAPMGVLDGVVDSQGRIWVLDVGGRRVEVLNRKAG